MIRPDGTSSLSAEFMPGQTMRFRYTNWQGDIATRAARVIRLTYGSNEWHKQPQWLLEAFDIEKGEVRLFALKDMLPVK